MAFPDHTAATVKSGDSTKQIGDLLGLCAFCTMMVLPPMEFLASPFRSRALPRNTNALPGAANGLPSKFEPDFLSFHLPSEVQPVS